MLIDTNTPKSELVTQDPGVDSSERPWILIMAAMLVVHLWIGLIGSSLWRDEAGTWWAVKDGAAEAARRALYWGGTSPLYYLIVSLFTRVAGLSEISLRLPSVLAMTGAIYFLYKIAQRLYDRASAAVVTLVFLCLASYYAIDARPYAVAMLCLTASTWALLRWIDTRKAAYAIAYAVTAALVVYAHYILALGLPPVALLAIVTLRKEPRRLAFLGCLLAAIGLLSLPLVGQLAFLSATRASHTVVDLPGPPQIINGLVPGSLAGLLVFAVWVYYVWRGKASLSQKCDAPSALLIGTWSLFAPLFLFLLPFFGHLKLFVDRYYSSALPGQALLLGGMIASIRPGGGRKVLMALLVTCTIVAQGRLSVSNHGHEDWRAALEYIQKNAGREEPVLLQSCFAEGTDFAALRDPRLHDVLFAPTLVYGEPANAVRVPVNFDGIDSPDAEEVVRRVQHAPRFLLLHANLSPSFEMWLLGKLGSGCKSELVDTFGDLPLTRITCAE